MACLKPIIGYRSPDGKVVFNPRGAYIDRTVPVSCGQCRGCRISRAQAWAVRCVHETQIQAEAGRGSSFITLTYDAGKLPADLSLNVRDLQLFFKRLRKRGVIFRYLACGEYGEQNLRPHYHALIFGEDFSADRIEIGENEFGDKHYMSPLLSEVWKNGFCTVGAVSWSSAAYVSGYIITKANGDEAKRRYRRNDGSKSWFVSPEFSVSSRKPCIGGAWFEKYKSDVYPSDFVIVDGRKRKIPKAYDRMVELTAPSVLQAVKLNRKAMARKFRSSLTQERLDARSAILDYGFEKKGL